MRINRKLIVEYFSTAFCVMVSENVAIYLEFFTR